MIKNKIKTLSIAALTVALCVLYACTRENVTNNGTEPQNVGENATNPFGKRTARMNALSDGQVLQKMKDFSDLLSGKTTTTAFGSRSYDEATWLIEAYANFSCPLKSDENFLDKEDSVEITTLVAGGMVSADSLVSLWNRLNPIILATIVNIADPSGSVPSGSIIADISSVVAPDGNLVLKFNIYRATPLADYLALPNGNKTTINCVDSVCKFCSTATYSYNCTPEDRGGKPTGTYALPPTPRNMNLITDMLRRFNKCRNGNGPVTANKCKWYSEVERDPLVFKQWMRYCPNGKALTATELNTDLQILLDGVLSPLPLSQIDNKPLEFAGVLLKTGYDSNGCCVIYRQYIYGRCMTTPNPG